MIKITNYTMKYDFDCGPTSLAILLSAYGKKYQPDDLIKILNTTEEKGTAWESIKNFLVSLNMFELKVHQSISRAKKLLEKPVPLLVCWDVFGNPENSHYSVLIKMDDKSVSILDPEDKGKFTTHKFSEFKKDWEPYLYWSVELVPKIIEAPKNKSRGAVTGDSHTPKKAGLNVSMVRQWIKQAEK